MSKPITPRVDVEQLAKPGTRRMPADTPGMSRIGISMFPVCCCPNVVHVEIEKVGDIRVWAERE